MGVEVWPHQCLEPLGDAYHGGSSVLGCFSYTAAEAVVWLLIGCFLSYTLSIVASRWYHYLRDRKVPPTP